MSETDAELIERIGIAALRRNEQSTRRHNFRVALVFMRSDVAANADLPR